MLEVGYNTGSFMQGGIIMMTPMDYLAVVP